MSVRKPVTAQAIAERQERGETIADIATDLGVSKATLFRRLADAGIRLRRTADLRMRETQGILAARAAGQTINDIAAAWHRDPATIRRILRDHGLPASDRGEPERAAPGHWADRAACAGTDPRLWFPPEHAGRRTDQDRAKWAAGKAVCAACPVRHDCLAHALEQGEAYGLWGSLTPEERHQLATVGGNR